MSDRPDTSRPAAEAAGGWFVPKNAMTEQQIAALAPQVATPNVPMPDSATPQRGGGWYVPAGAVQLPVSKANLPQPAPSAKSQAAQPQASQQPAQPQTAGNGAPFTDDIAG